jgi:hypothetical protein
MRLRVSTYVFLGSADDRARGPQPFVKERSSHNFIGSHQGIMWIQVEGLVQGCRVEGEG